MGDRRIGSLFSGIGLLELGLERAGLGHTAWQAEIDPYCRAVLRRHWPAATRYNDVREVDHEAARVDVLCGGFPCQPFSAAGKRGGLDDVRWLWPEYARIIEDQKPAIVIGENVPGLRKAGLPAVLADLARLGFDAEWCTFRAAHLGAPHERNRVWVVATHPDRVLVRDEPGWLSRAIWAAARVVADHGEAWPLADAEALGRDARGAQSVGRADDCAGREEGHQQVASNAYHQRQQKGWAGGNRADDIHAAGRGGCGPDVPEATVHSSGNGRDGASAADAHREGQPRWSERAERGWARDSGWRDAPSAIRGVDDGRDEGLDGLLGPPQRGEGEAGDDEQAPDSWRVAGLGNAVVLQCAELVGRATMQAIRGEP